MYKDTLDAVRPIPHILNICKLSLLFQESSPLFVNHVTTHDHETYGGAAGGGREPDSSRNMSGSSSKRSTKDSTPTSVSLAESSKSSRSSTQGSGGGNNSTGIRDSISRGQSVAATDIDTAKDLSIINFVSGNPFVEVTKGILHLYKENQTTSLEDGVLRSQMLCKHN